VVQNLPGMNPCFVHNQTVLDQIRYILYHFVLNYGSLWGMLIRNTSLWLPASLLRPLLWIGTTSALFHSHGSLHSTIEVL
jgi:hypothetical protein